MSFYCGCINKNIYRIREEKVRLEMDLNLDLFNEDGVPMKEGIENRIINKITDKLYKSVKENYDIKIGEVVVEKVDQLLDNTYKEFLEQEVRITDSYGDYKETGNLKAILKARFDKWLNEQVNESGRSKGYGETYTRLTWAIEGQLKTHSKQFVQDSVDAVVEKLEKVLSDDLRNTIGERIAQKIGLNKLLPKMKKGLKQ